MSETYAAVSDEFGHGDNVRDELIHEVVALRCQFATQAESLATARREVETAQSESRFRGETIDALRREVAGWEERTKHLGSVVLRAWEVLRQWWQFSKLEERDEPFADALARAITADREHDDYALSEMRRLNAVIETVTRERDLARIDALNERTRRKAVEAERDADVVSLTDENETLTDDLATSRAALEDVRRVEAWIQAGNAPDLPEHSIAGLVNARYGAIVRWEDEETTVATGDSLEALGRALAQEETTHG